MRTSRLEAFSDGVIAIIITIMVLALDRPEGDTLAALAGSTESLYTYVLSFVFVGIYWVNHHHLFQVVERVTGAVLWANMNLLFWLSLYPFTTAWVDDTSHASAPVMVYGANLFAAALAYYLLVLAIKRSEGPDGPLSQAIGTDFRDRIAPVLYLAGICVALVSAWGAMACFAAVAASWLIPDRRIESFVAEHDPEN